MSNLIPPLLSSTPPPILGPLDEDDDDEFGDFRAAADSYDCDDLSLPPSPQKSPEKEVKSDLSKVNLDINSNSQKIASTTETPTQNSNESVNKDYQDRRKNIEEPISSTVCENQVNCSVSHPVTGVSNEDSSSSELEKNKCVKNHSENSGQTSFIDSDDQIHDFDNPADDNFTDMQCGAINPITNCDEIQSGTVNQLESETNKITEGPSQDDLNSLSNEENLFEDFSESIQLEKTNSDDLSELNDIKSEDDCLEEINSENPNENDVEDDKDDNSSTELNCETSELSVSLKVGATDPKLSEDEFGDFENHFGNEFQKSDKDEEIQHSTEDEFDDFASPVPPPEPSGNENEEDDDDFGDFASSNLTKEDFDDFGDFSSHPNSSCEKPVMVELNAKDAVAQSEIILKEIFPPAEKEVDDFEQVDETKGNLIFEELKDITETNALLYQWSKSNSQKMFLKALNIDLRNILYGPAWNASMPRFAANLGLTPLEPVKSEILTPTPVQNASSPSNSSQKISSDIPTAQFDWSGSGLINPLDYLEQLVASLDIPSTTNPTSNQSPSPSNELLYEWDMWLQSTSTELPGNVPEDSSRSHLKTADLLPGSNDAEKSDPLPSLFDMETLQKPANDQTSIGISSNFELPKSSNDQLDDFTPFQSPKVMIPLRETHISNEIIGEKPGWLEPTILTPDLPRKEPIIDPDDEDEFDAFQMVLPEEKPKSLEINTPPILKESLPDLSEFDMTSSSVNKNQEHISGIVKLETTLLKNKSPVEKVDKNDDDEFTDFHSHSSLPQSSILTPLQPVPVEPLKPAVQYITPMSTQINWPEPGVTDEDIRNIELSYSRKNERKTEISKENSVEEEEWSDFVSVNTVKSSLPERTATPDLPLSVLNLNNVQAPKQPIPVITPTGLLQTKLSSNVLQPTNVVQTSVQPSLYKPQQNQFQPSIISNLFPTTSSCNGGTSQSQDDDEDWSDFVSSQPLPQMSNGFQQKQQMKPVQVNWGNATTNIIMNPSHFDSFSKYVSQQGKSNKSASMAKAAISSISAIPDLEFIGPKSRTKK